jgi:hypothetical protein
MTPLDAALGYALRGLPVFPCRWDGPARKKPFTSNGFYDASTDPDRICLWFGQKWPEALIGAPTGAATGFIVLDIDIKEDLANGWDSLEDLGHSILPDSPVVHTASGGCHWYFAHPERELKCSTGLLGPGLDVRATGGYVIMPSPNSGYEWDPICNFDTVPLAPAPSWLWPPKLSRSSLAKPPLRPVQGLSPYGTATVEGACAAIVRAPAGEQERTLNAECFSVGTAVGAGLIPAGIALSALLNAAAAMPDHDSARPWRPEEIDLKVRRAFAAGQAKPREVRRAVYR